MLFEETSKKAVPLIISSKQNANLSIEELTPIYHVWNTLIILSELMEILFTKNYDETINKEMIQYVTSQKPIIKVLVELLHVAQVHLPKASKLSDFSEMNQTTVNQESEKCQYFPRLKIQIITLLGILTRGNRAVQDEIRERQGLELVLSNCVIDIYNLFIKESAILCLKYLLQDNEQNQNIVRQLEAKTDVLPKELDEAGLETEFIDGKLALKKKPSKIEELPDEKQ